MSTRETHPIDELFRRKLAEAEVAPPASVWAGIEGARRSRRWLPLWFRMNGILLLIIPAAGLVTYLSWPSTAGTIHADDTSTSHTSIEIAENGLIQVGEETRGNSIGPSIHTAELITGSSGSGADQASEPRMADPATDHLVTRSNSDPGYFASRSTQQDGPTSAAIDPAIQQHKEGLYAAAAGIEDEKTRSEEPFNRSENAAPGVASDLHRSAGSGETFFIKPLQISLTPGHTDRIMENAILPPPYVLPPAEWVLSAIVGTYDVKRTWRGNDHELVKALNGTEARTSSIGLGISFGRHWHSGWGISGGLIGERSEQQFRFVDRRVDVTQEVITHIVTLNSQVFVNESDTIDHVTTTEQRYEGINQRNVFRIPIEALYHRNLGRLNYGLRAGLALEFTTEKKDHGIDLDREEGRTIVTRLSEGELRERHPAMLMVTAGVDLGYTINERWSIWANPMYMAPATALSPVGEAWSSASRFGVQFRLSHHFNLKKVR